MVKDNMDTSMKLEKDPYYRLAELFFPSFDPEEDSALLEIITEIISNFSKSNSSFLINKLNVQIKEHVRKMVQLDEEELEPWEASLKMAIFCGIGICNMKALLSNCKNTKRYPSEEDSNRLRHTLKSIIEDVL